jgi:release factor glutamine methyltransferase
MNVGALRRITQPIACRILLRRARNNTVTTHVGGFRLHVLPTVFHPRYFGSSLIFGNYLESVDLRNRSFLDMGTGSGIIALFAARAGANVTAVDINPQAIRCASDNAIAAASQIVCHQSDLFSGLEGKQFDVMAWNPPFFPKAPADIAEMALYAGEDYAVIARFARDARAHLKPEGRIFLIVSMDLEVARIESMFKTQGFCHKRVFSRRWGLGETMVVIEFR